MQPTCTLYRGRYHIIMYARVYSWCTYTPRDSAPTYSPRILPIRTSSACGNFFLVGPHMWPMSKSKSWWGGESRYSCGPLPLPQARKDIRSLQLPIKRQMIGRTSLYQSLKTLDQNHDSLVDLPCFSSISRTTTWHLHLISTRFFTGNSYHTISHSHINTTHLNSLLQTQLSSQTHQFLPQKTQRSKRSLRIRYPKIPGGPSIRRFNRLSIGY